MRVLKSKRDESVSFLQDCFDNLLACADGEELRLGNSGVDETAVNIDIDKIDACIDRLKTELSIFKRSIKGK